MSYIEESKEAIRLIEVDVLKETEQAILIEYEDEEIWLPKSQILEMGADEVKIPIWLAKEKGLV